MKRTGIVILLAAVLMLSWALACHAQQDPANVGTPAFKPVSSKSGNMTLRYGFLGASVYDGSTKKWNFHKMTTITRSKVERLADVQRAVDAMLAVIQEKRLATIDAKVKQKGDQLDDANRSLVPPSGQMIDPDPFGPGEYEPQLF